MKIALSCYVKCVCVMYVVRFLHFPWPLARASWRHRLKRLRKRILQFKDRNIANAGATIVVPSTPPKQVEPGCSGPQRKSSGKGHRAADDDGHLISGEPLRHMAEAAGYSEGRRRSARVVNDVHDTLRRHHANNYRLMPNIVP